MEPLLIDLWSQREMPPRQTYNTLPSADTACQIKSEYSTGQEQKPPQYSADSLAGLKARLQSARTQLLGSLEWWLQTFKCKFTSG